LAARLDDGALSVPACIELGLQLMRALYDCHAQGFIHCDVKPQNIIVNDSDTPLVKLVDFGICQRIRQVSAAAASSSTIGTPPYMSPEQIQGRPLDLRTDIYSAGVVLYQALTRRLPFDGSTAEELMGRALRAPIIPPRLLREHCPIELERVIMRMLCRKAEFRYSSARLVADELGWIANKHDFVRGRSAWGACSSMLPPSTSEQLEPTRPLPTPPPWSPPPNLH
jgi:serine/threonine-protein kinase